MFLMCSASAKVGKEVSINAPRYRRNAGKSRSSLRCRLILPWIQSSNRMNGIRMTLR